MKSYLTVKVQTRAAEPRVEKTGEREYKVSVIAAPTKGKANAEVIGLLAQHLGIARSQLKIVRGETSRHKLVVVDL
ncbi:MAG: DUF167 domain-containing protein [Candidatus Aminicenantes bacterium]|nr:DUF167 domain-containing protein [Candidatus Aminicenantes bacterium]